AAPAAEVPTAAEAPAQVEAPAKATAKPAKATKKPAKRPDGKAKRQSWPTRRPKQAKANPPKLIRRPFESGERLLYQVKMFNAVAGEAILAVGEPTMHAGRRAQPLAGWVRSSEFLNKFYPVENRYVALLDDETYLPLKTDFYIRENGESIDYHTTYDHRAKLVQSTREKGGKTLKRNFSAVTPLYEAIGSVFGVRRMDLKPGDAFDYYVWDGRKERWVDIKAVGIERVWTEMGWFDALKVEVETRITGGFIKKDMLDRPIRRGTIWISQDEQRLPVKLITPTKLGDAEAVLVRRYIEKDGGSNLTQARF
ncbi:MAG: DUF3108 domain-containing protein, partial [Myxococcales bacterium]|nr:DUF3108 domain-containing protein [Myxococcales bacterium]